MAFRPIPPNNLEPFMVSVISARLASYLDLLLSLKYRSDDLLHSVLHHFVLTESASNFRSPLKYWAIQRDAKIVIVLIIMFEKARSFPLPLRADTVVCKSQDLSRVVGRSRQLAPV